MTSELTTNTRTICDLIDTQHLPAKHLDVGIGGPTSVDITVTHTSDLDPWTAALGVVAKQDEHGRWHIRVDRDGLYVHVSALESTGVPACRHCGWPRKVHDPGFSPGDPAHHCDHWEPLETALSVDDAETAVS